MAIAPVIVLMIVAVATRKARSEPIEFEFEYGKQNYWVGIDEPGTYNYAAAQRACMKHWANLVSISGAAEYVEIEKQVAAKIPDDLKKVELWSKDRDTSDLGTHVMWAITKERTSGKENKPKDYRGNGYICKAHMVFVGK